MIPSWIPKPLYWGPAFLSEGWSRLDSETAKEIKETAVIIGTVVGVLAGAGLILYRATTPRFWIEAHQAYEYYKELTE